MNDYSKSRAIALLITLLTAFLLMLLLVFGYLSTQSVSKTREWPPSGHAEILFADEIADVRVSHTAESGDNVLEPLVNDEPGPSDVDADVDTQLSADAKDESATEGVNTNLVTSEAESPVRHKTDSKPGNSKPKETQAPAQGTNSQKSKKNVPELPGINRFSGKGKGNGNSDNPTNRDGNDATGGTTGGRGLDMTANINQRPSSPDLGVIIIECIVDGDGRVSNPRFRQRGSSGKAAENQALKAECIRRATQCQFSRPKGSPTASGIIRFVWK